MGEGEKVKGSKCKCRGEMSVITWSWLAVTGVTAVGLLGPARRLPARKDTL